MLWVIHAWVYELAYDQIVKNKQVKGPLEDNQLSF